MADCGAFIFFEGLKNKKVAAIQVLLVESVEGLWQPLRELNFNYSGISVASALRVSMLIKFLS
jgi:hypothetical protein